MNADTHAVVRLTRTIGKEIIVPAKIVRAAGFEDGEQLRFIVRGRTIEIRRILNGQTRGPRK